MDVKMIRITFFALLFLVVSQFIYAQTPMYYNNNNAPGNPNAFPLSSVTSNQVQWLYGPNIFNSLGQTGVPAPAGFITTIYFRCPNVNQNAIYTNFTISLAQNMGTQNSFTNGTFITGLSQVFYQQTFNLAGIVANQWYAIPLQNMFLYDPALSLVWEMKVSAGTGNNIAQATTAGLNQRIWGTYGNAAGSFGTALADFGFDLIPPVPCSGVPVLGQISMGNISACPGFSGMLTLTGNQLASGLNYQWEQSNNGGASWTNVVGGTGANTPNYTTPVLMTTTMYRLFAECVNSGLSATTPPITITISTPSYINSFPYHQSFEDWTTYCGLKDIPTDPVLPNHWTAVPATGNNSWRRNDEGTTANWTNPGMSAYMPASSHGQHSARFHSRNTPLSGNLDLYLDLSTTPGTKTLMFDFINNNALGGSDYMDIFISQDAGINFTPVGIVNNSPQWQTFLFPITSNSPTTLIRMRGVGDNLLASGTDMGLDNLYILPPCTGTPVAGVIADTTPCANTPFKLTLQGNVIAGDLTYMWESAPTPGGPWTLVANTLTPNVTTQIAAPTYFRCTVTCTNSSLSHTTPVKYIELGSFYFCYCNSQSTTLAIAQNIGNVTLINTNNDTLISNGNPLPLVNSAQAMNFYSNFFGLTPPDMYRDSSYAVSVTCFSQAGTFSNGYAKVFIDLNRDGIYDPVDELVASGVVNAPTNLLSSAMSLPSNAQYGLTGMRVVYQVGGTAVTVGPCGTYANGETEDYIINIAPPPCNTPPYAGVAHISDTITCPGYTVFLTDTTHDVIYSGLSFNWQFSNDGIQFFDIPGAVLDTLTYTVNASTWFRFRTTCNGASDAFSNVVKVTMSPPFACYGNSQSTGGSLDSSDIGAFLISDYSTNTNIYSFISGGPHLMNPSAIRKRTDYTSSGIIDLYVDSLYKFSVYHILKGAVHADARVTIFIDYNNNQLYDIPEERVFNGIADMNNFYLTGAVKTPLSPAISVKTGLRIVLNNDLGQSAASDNGVGTYVSGETEDYLVRFNLKLFGPSSINDFYAIKEVTLYPNPAHDKVYIGLEMSESSNIEISLLSITGSLIHKHSLGKTSGKHVEELPIGHLAKGSYLIKIDSEKGSLVRKLLVD